MFKKLLGIKNAESSKESSSTEQDRTSFITFRKKKTEEKSQKGKETPKIISNLQSMLNSIGPEQNVDKSINTGSFQNEVIGKNTLLHY